MKHTEETIKATEEYAKERSSSPVFRESHERDFLAGYERCIDDMDKNKEPVDMVSFLYGVLKEKDQHIQELVEALDYANHTIRMLIASKPMRDVDETLAHQDKLIQKYK